MRFINAGPTALLRGYFRQQRIEGNEIFHRAGFQDLTADVKLTDLQVWGDECDFKIVNYLTQREFVFNWTLSPALKKRSARNGIHVRPGWSGNRFQGVASTEGITACFNAP